MHTENRILIDADMEVIYELAAGVERWPALLPHYRWVRVLSETGPRRLVDMAARRDWIPVRWWAEQERFPEIPAIAFRHVGGVTRGMEVRWDFHRTPEGVLVTISHDLRLGWPLIGGVVADRVIGPQFVANIASKTLRQLKLLAEGGASVRTPLGQKAVEGS